MKKHLSILAALLTFSTYAQWGDVASAQTPAPQGTVEEETMAFELVSFVADPVEGEGVTLRWTTGAEMPRNVFTIQRSYDRIHWHTTITMDGEGDQEGYTAYSVVDLDPIPGLAYYRVVASVDGQELETSDEFAVEYAVRPALRITGDPIPGRFSVQGNGVIGDMQLLNNRGQFVPMEINYSGDTVFVRAEGLEPGTYYVHATVNGTPVLKPVMITTNGVFGG